MTKTTKRTILVVGVFFVSFLVLLVCQQISLKFFFDKFYYQKSQYYGYVPSHIPFKYADYGYRAVDLARLESGSPPALLSTNKPVYNIVVIGDSHVWGQGVSNDERFAYILEKRLNKIRPTKVYSYGKPGNNLLNNSDTYSKVVKQMNPNLLIILPVSNDSVLNPADKDNPVVIECQKLSADAPAVYFKPENDLSPSFISDVIKNSWENPTNLCIDRHSLTNLSKTNSIYLVDRDYYRDNKALTVYKELLEEGHSYLLSTEVGKFMDDYKRYFNEQTYNNFNVSERDEHPSAVSNRLYSDILFEELTKNARWRFKSNAK